MKYTRYGLALLAALTILSAGVSRGLLAQEYYDQQQWWNPGDWFDSDQQYNLFSDQYWDNHSNNYTSGDYGYDYDHRDYDLGFNDRWDYDSDYGAYDSWDNDLWDDDSAVGTSGNYESGSDWSDDE